MATPPDQGELDPRASRSRTLTVHTELHTDEEGEHHLEGWVECPSRGHLDLEQCSACMHCHGVLLEPKPGAPKVLCSWGRMQASRSSAGTDDTAGAWVARPALSVTCEVPVREIGEMMRLYKVDVVLVASSRRTPIGMVTERELLPALLAGRLNTPVLEIMRGLDEVRSASTPMRDCALDMARRGARALPLADHDGSIFAMLTWSDIVRWATRERANIG